MDSGAYGDLERRGRLVAAVERAFALASELDAATDALNAALADAEAAIVGLRLGVRASARMDPRDNTDREAECFLTFGKYNGAWRLLCDVHRPGASSTVPLTSASRCARISGALTLSDLVEKLVRVAGNEVVLVREATKRVNDDVVLLRRPVSRMGGCDAIHPYVPARLGGICLKPAGHDGKHEGAPDGDACHVEQW